MLISNEKFGKQWMRHDNLKEYNERDKQEKKLRNKHQKLTIPSAVWSTLHKVTTKLWVCSMTRNLQICK